MELGQSEPKIAALDSLFSAEDSDEGIRKLRSRVTNFELAIQHQAELQLKQQRLMKEQAEIQKVLVKIRVITLTDNYLWGQFNLKTTK